MSAQPRTVHHWPRMKDRAAGRAKRKARRIALERVSDANEIDWPAVTAAICAAFDRASRALQGLASQFVLLSRAVSGLARAEQTE